MSSNIHLFILCLCMAIIWEFWIVIVSTNVFCLLWLENFAVVVVAYRVPFVTISYMLMSVNFLLLNDTANNDLSLEEALNAARRKYKYGIFTFF